MHYRCLTSATISATSFELYFTSIYNACEDEEINSWDFHLADKMHKTRTVEWKNSPYPGFVPKPWANEESITQMHDGIVQRVFNFTQTLDTRILLLLLDQRMKWLLFRCQNKMKQDNGIFPQASYRTCSPARQCRSS